MNQSFAKSEQDNGITHKINALTKVASLAVQDGIEVC